jgi:hypothetical protein
VVDRIPMFYPECDIRSLLLTPLPGEGAFLRRFPPFPDIHLHGTGAIAPFQQQLPVLHADNVFRPP